MTATVVSFHAHPDDEVLLTGGTLARLAADGHRVVIVMATDGIVEPAGRIASRSRLDELEDSAAALGVARVVYLGYADSGYGPVLFPDPPGQVRFARADIGQAAAQLAAVLHEEQADVLISYDAVGGYGHRDHIRVHQVGRRAVQIAGNAGLLEATFPREPVTWLARASRPLRLVARKDGQADRAWGTPRPAITHRVDVRKYARQKRAALAAHKSQAWPASRGRLARVLWVLARLPVPVFGLLLGREWFVEPGTRPGARRTIILGGSEFIVIKR
jgi:LmbE family N-acetylglucosaminyl deacetylase